MVVIFFSDEKINRLLFLRETFSVAIATLIIVIAIWLILPVVIRSSQRLSHACVSINNFTLKLRMAHYISYSLLEILYYLDNRSNSRANT